MDKDKKLYRVNEGKILAGVCAGLAEYFNIDATLIRLLWVIVSFASGLFMGLLAYVVCVFVIPEDPGCIDVEYKEK